jgi:hypothetical protein
MNICAASDAWQRIQIRSVTTLQVILIHEAHLLSKRRSAKKSRRNGTLVVFNCVGLLVNESPGRLPENPLLSHPMIFLFCREPIHFRLHERGIIYSPRDESRALSKYFRIFINIYTGC